MNATGPITEAQLRRIQRPTDYFSGRESEPWGLPSRILVFHRNSYREIIEHQGKVFHHKRFVLIHCLAGSGHVLINQEAVEMKPGKLCLIYPYELHYFVNFPACKVSWLFITFEGDLKNSPEWRGDRAWGCGPHVRQLLRSLLDCWIENKKGLAHYLALILLELKRSDAKSDTPEFLSTFLRVNQILNTNPDANWSLEEIARMAGLSAGRLSTLFRKETQTSLGSYVREYRATRAAHYLATTDRRVGEIAETCGYNSPYAFSRAFKAVMGEPPQAYRNRLREGRIPPARASSGKSDSPV